MGGGTRVMPYNVGCFNSLSGLGVKTLEIKGYQEDSFFKKTAKFNLAGMIQKYESPGLKYNQILASKMCFNGGDIAVQIDSFSEHFGERIFDQLDFFEKVYFVGETKESSLRLKSSLKNIFPNMKFPNSLDLNIEDQSVDVVYAVSRQSDEETTECHLKSEIFRILKQKGILYLTCITKDYDDSIKQLYKEFDSTYKLNEGSVNQIKETKSSLKGYFPKMESNEYNFTMNITDSNDLITYILASASCEEIKLTIARKGLSNFRNFLLEKLEREGSIKIERHIELLTCFKETIQIS